MSDRRRFWCFHRGYARVDNIMPWDMGSGRYRKISEVEKIISCAVEECPSKSSRTVESALGVSHFLANHMHEMHVGRLRIGLTIHVA